MLYRDRYVMKNLFEILYRDNAGGYVSCSDTLLAAAAIAFDAKYKSTVNLWSDNVGRGEGPAIQLTPTIESKYIPA